MSHSMDDSVLRNPEPHHDIHQAAWNEVEKLTTWLRESSPDSEERPSVLKQLLDIWTTRIISHAKAEEDTLYKDLKDQAPDMKADWAKMLRDHELLERWIAAAKSALNQSGGHPERYFEAALALLEHHMVDEEDMLGRFMHYHRAF